MLEALGAVGYAGTETAPELPPDLADALTDAIRADTLDLPLLPEVAQRVLALATSEGASMAAIADVLHRDPSMAAHVLSVANSPLYAPRVPIVSLTQAVSRLGARQIRDIALVVSCKSRVFQVRGWEREVRGLFRHSVATAVFAQEAARRLRANVEEAFLAGLLHDVGRPVLLQAVADAAEELGVEAPRRGVAAFTDQHHEEVGRRLAARWKLAPTVQAAIGAHHDATAAAGAERLAHVVGLADALSDIVVEGSPPDLVRGHPALAALNLYPDDLDALIAASERVEAAVGALA